MLRNNLTAEVFLLLNINVSEKRHALQTETFIVIKQLWNKNWSFWYTYGAIMQDPLESIHNTFII